MNYFVFYLPISISNLLTSVANNDRGIWSDSMLIKIDYYGLRLVVISLAINAHYYSHKSDFHKSDWSLKQFTLFINCTIWLLVLLLKLGIVFTDQTFIGLIGPKVNSSYL